MYVIFVVSFKYNTTFPFTCCSLSNGIKFRQLTNGRQLVQIIYDGDIEIQDCDIVHQRQQITSFLEDFRKDVQNLSATSNVTIHHLHNTSLPGEIRSWLRYNRLRKLCRKRQQHVKEALEGLKEEDGKSRWVKIDSYFRNLFTWYLIYYQCRG